MIRLDVEHSGKIIANFLHHLGLEAACDFRVFGNVDCILQHWKNIVSCYCFLLAQ